MQQLRAGVRTHRPNQVLAHCWARWHAHAAGRRSARAPFRVLLTPTARSALAPPARAAPRIIAARSACHSPAELCCYYRSFALIPTICYQPRNHRHAKRAAL
jgi:hypothetical protein